MIPTPRPKSDEVKAPHPPGMEPHRAGRLLALSVLGLFLFPLSVPLFLRGWNDLERMRQGRLDPAGRSQTLAAMACSGFMTAVLCAALVVTPFVVMGYR